MDDLRACGAHQAPQGLGLRRARVTERNTPASRLGIEHSRDILIAR
jgi:hypothetical protein